MTEQDLAIQNLRRENAALQKKIKQLETTVLILKTQVEELHQQTKRDRLVMSEGFHGEAHKCQNQSIH